MRLHLHLGFEIKGEIERLAHPDVGEFRAAQVENESLHALHFLGVEFFLDDASASDGRKIILRHPFDCAGTKTDIHWSPLKASNAHGAVPEKHILDLVKIILPFAHAEILGPVILDALIGRSNCAGDESLDLVGAGAERQLQRRVGDVAGISVCILAFPIMLGKPVSSGQ